MSNDPVRSLEPFCPVHVSGRCNLGCFYCYEEHGAIAADMWKKRIETRLELGARAGYRTVAFSTGEIFLLRGWEGLLRKARELGYVSVAVVTNLTLLSNRVVDVLEELCVDVVGGTIFATSDDEAERVCGKKGVWSGQVNAIRLLSGREKPRFIPHIMLTAAMTADLERRIESLEKLVGSRLETLMLSAIEPVSATVRAHRCYTDALKFDWGKFIGTQHDQGRFVVVQNIPACSLGAWSHRSFVVRKRVGRLLEGLPEDAKAAAMVADWESLRCRVPPEGPCKGCRLLGVCHRFYEYRLRVRQTSTTEQIVVARMLREESTDGDPDRIADKLRKIELGAMWTGRV